MSQSSPTARPRRQSPRQKRFGAKLRAWFRRSHRDLPWRRTRDPYRILVSELMLQQTQVARVIDYYTAFLERFPSLEDVARVPESAVLDAWAGLGYYARARNLHRLAKQLVALDLPGQRIPRDVARLRELPGIGAYTAGAIASFAYEQRAPLVDTNVARVLRRVFAPRADWATAAGQAAIWKLADQTLPTRGPTVWVHNQALMELGALVCTARVMHCHRCPVRRECATGRTTRA